MAFQVQTSFPHLQILQQDMTPSIQERKKCKYIGNSGFYPIQSRSPILDSFQELIERYLNNLLKQVEKGYQTGKWNLTKAEH